MGLERVLFVQQSWRHWEQGFPPPSAATCQAIPSSYSKVEPFSHEDEKLPIPEMDGPEMKYRFGRHVEQLSGANIFGYRV